jgi:hypothetical protein
MKKTTWPGNWKVTCQVCGFQYPSGEIKKRWDGLLVCAKDHEPRHPQTLIRVPRESDPPPFTTGKEVDTYLLVCDIGGSSGYASLATTDCARADNTQYPFDIINISTTI